MSYFNRNIPKARKAAQKRRREAKASSWEKELERTWLAKEKQNDPQRSH